jgi:hypothetical protein
MLHDEHGGQPRLEFHGKMAVRGLAELFGPATARGVSAHTATRQARASVGTVEAISSAA